MSYRPFNFNLSSEQEARAKELHAKAIIIDMLYQGPLTTLNFPQSVEERLEKARSPTASMEQFVYGAMYGCSLAAAQGDLPEFREAWLASGVTGGNRQVTQEAGLGLRSYGIAQVQFDRFDWMIKALKAEDFRRAKADGKVAGYISTQGGPGDSLAQIEDGYNLGLRMIQLTYNTLTKVGAGCTERTDSGVSLYGKRCIEKMNDLGIIVDTGHCGRQTTLDACALSRKPVVASHTAVSALYLHDRSKSDEEIRALAKTGGIIGILAIPFILKSGTHADINDYLDHIDYVCRLVGFRHVGLGTDYPLSLPERIARTGLMDLSATLGFRPEHNVDGVATLAGFDTYLDYPNITRGLVSRGYSDDEITAILGGNFLRVFEEACG